MSNQNNKSNSEQEEKVREENKVNHQTIADSPEKKRQKYASSDLTEVAHCSTSQTFSNTKSDGIVPIWVAGLIIIR